MRMVAKSSGVTLEMENGIPIQEVTKQAFIQLGDNGVIKCAQNHSCSECTHKYKKLQIESQVMILLLYLVLMRIIKYLFL